ncbi:hypothetical protein L7F22_048359 [Adiantum nelumboides]|nr:hypothetical protein [Adiantum nelumboides]
MADNNIDVFKMFATEDRWDGDNYPMWAYMMQHVLVSKGVWNIVQGIDVRPGSVDIAEVVDVACPSTRIAAASESSDDPEYAPASEENTSEDHDQASEDSPSSSRVDGSSNFTVRHPGKLTVSCNRKANDHFPGEECRLEVAILKEPSSVPQPTPQMTSPIGTVGPAPSTIVHHTGLTAATTISMEPSTSTPTPRTSAPQGITHFMSRADKLLQMERSATLSIANAINTIHGAQKMHAVTYEIMYEELLDTHQRVYDRDVEKAALFDRNRILNRQVKDLKEVISSLNLQLREAQEQLQQKSVVTTMVCERCAQMELTVTTPTPVATISLPTQGIPTTYSGGVSLASHTLTGSHEQTEVVTSMPLPPHGVFTCPLPGWPYVGAFTYAPSMPPTPFVSSSAPIQPNPTIYSSHFGTLPQYNMQLPTPHHLPSPSQALVSSFILSSQTLLFTHLILVE